MAKDSIFTPREWRIIYCAVKRHFRAYGESCETLKEIDQKYLDEIADIIAIIKQQF